MITKKSIDLAALAQQEGFKRLDLQTYIIIRKLVETPDALMKTMKAHSQELVHRHEESDALAIRLQQQTLDAIYGSTPRQPDVSVEETRQNVIDILKFRQMSAREDDIADAHHKTFQWILAEEAHGGASFSALMPWLRKAHGTYWITGKAGSGKSTLMKFLGANEKVKDALQSWASPQKLIVASFYFWRSGTLLQRSQEGLLRSLLHTILDQRRDLVRICFPEQFDQIEVYNRKASETVLGLELVTKAFKRLSCSDLSELRVCLFIDAVDEFEGDHEEMSKFFQDLASTPAIKIILSSRATPMYTEAFGSLPSLLLQDLTHHDIKTYVEAIIGRHARMEMLLSENKHEASRLIGAILSKASGVFLWVRLVVKSLLDGFRNYDRICDLQERVHECPQELGNLYNHMFHSMEPRYQKHSAQLLRIVVRSIEVQKDKALTILQLSFADDGDLQRALDAPVSLITEAEREARSVAMTGRIRSRCCGLVEIRDSVVELIHSSVLDFLLGGEVWGAVLTLTPLFDPNAVLIAAILMNIKVNSTEELDLKIALSHFQRYCELREKLAPGSRAGAIAELKRKTHLAAQSTAWKWNLQVVPKDNGDLTLRQSLMKEHL
ncbi:hypothetical protein HBI81_195080 [Parastagonospora nodorum]|nr:hypothetical protein HBI09_202450 [Parastagonospora nodorum]KAH4050021.1 hypothetical protein HBH49_141010 [Parastagonospora nodorum]KAH4981546.1 hypothetical protein HBI77_220150 [Parastagonospora nodorum]KAH5068661.1 hypothetical protein HBH95_190510 [Parastagonospora nodorum]KAH5177363.1 hypothetical protein HBH76_201630 [Parastagonospora nodorum]